MQSYPNEICQEGGVVWTQLTLSEVRNKSPGSSMEVSGPSPGLDSVHVFSMLSYPNLS